MTVTESITTVGAAVVAATIMGVAIWGICGGVDRAHRSELATALDVRGMRQVYIGDAMAFGGCLNGKGGTRWRYPWSAVDTSGRRHSGTACVGGFFMTPTIKER